MGKAEAGTIFISLQLATAELQAGIARAESQLKKLGNSAKTLGTSMSLAFSAPILGIGTAAVKAFAEFDQAMTNSIAFMGEAGKVMKTELVDGAMQVAATTTISAKEAAEGYGVLAQAGLTAAQSLKALPVVADFATVSQMKLADATETLVQIQHSLGLASKDAVKNAESLSHIGDVLTRASLDTTVSIQDLATALASQLGGALRASHTELETAAAVLEAFGSQGIKGAKAGTALGIVIRELGVDFLKHSKAFEKAGIEIFDSAGNYKNIVGIIQSMERAFAGMSDAQRLASIMSLGFTKRNAQFIQSLLGMGDAMANFEKRNYAARNEMSEMAKGMRTAFLSQMKMAWNNIKNVAIVIGGDLAPAILKCTQALSNFVLMIRDLPKGLRLTIEGGLALLATLGPLTFIFGQLATGGLAIWKVLSAVGGIFATVEVAAGGAASAVATGAGAFLAWPATVAVALAASAVAVYSYWDEIKDTTSAFMDWFAAKFPEIVTVSRAVWIVAAGVLDDFINYNVKVLNELPENWKNCVNRIRDSWIGGFTSEMVGVLNDFINFNVKILNTLVGYWGIASNKIRQYWIGAFAFGMVDTVNDFIDFNVETLNMIPSAVENVSNSIKNAWKSVVSTSEGIVTNDTIVNESTQALKEYQSTLEQNAKYISENEAAQRQAYFTWNAVATGALTSEEANAAWNAGAEKVSGTAKYQAKTLAELMGELEGNTKGANKAAGAMASLNDEFEKSSAKTYAKDVSEAIRDATDRLDVGAFENLKKELADATYQGSMAGLRKSIEKAGPENKAAAQKLAEDISNNKVREALNKVDAEFAKETAKHLKEAYKESVDFWRDLFGQAISEGGIDLEEVLTSKLKEVLVGFAAELATAIAGGVAGGFKNLGDLGGSIAQQLFSALTGKQFDSMSGQWIGSLLGNGVPRPEGVQGPLLPDGSFGASASGGISIGMIGAAAAAAMGTLLAGKSAYDLFKGNKDNSAQGQVGRGQLALSTGGLSEVARALGFGGSSRNPVDEAMHKFAGSIEEMVHKLDSIAFFNKDKKLEVGSAKQFNLDESKLPKDWATAITSLGKGAQGVFLGLGEAMKETMGLTDALGGKLGALLATQLSGNIDNARLLVQQLGLSMDDMVNGLIEVGKRGDQTWLAIQGQIQGVQEAFKPGLAAMGDLSGAMQELVDSGGRGIAALKGVRDIGVEAMEAGVKNLAELKNKLLAEGWSTDQVDAFMQALSQRGIKTLEELANASDATAGAIVADTNAASSTFTDIWAKASETFENIRKQIEALPTEVETNYKLKVSVEASPEAQDLMDNAGIETPAPTPAPQAAKLGVPGGAGVDAAMAIVNDFADGITAARMAKKSDISSRPVANITVNAPNATPGTERVIRRMMDEYATTITAQTTNDVARRVRRGGGYASQFDE